MSYESPQEVSPPRPQLTPHEHAALLAGVLMLVVFALGGFVLKEVSFDGEQLQAAAASETTAHASMASLPAGDAALPVPPLVVIVGLLFLLILGSTLALALVSCGQFLSARLRCVER